MLKLGCRPDIPSEFVNAAAHLQLADVFRVSRLSIGVAAVAATTIVPGRAGPAPTGSGSPLLSGSVPNGLAARGIPTACASSAPAGDGGGVNLRSPGVVRGHRLARHWKRFFTVMSLKTFIA
jgi:hypothetical protein